MRFRLTPKPEERELELSLEKTADGGINVKGDGFYLLKFKTNGEVRMTGSVPTKLGFKLTKRGSIRIYKEGIDNE